METKKSIRQAVAHRLLAQSEGEKTSRSFAIRQKLWKLPEFQKAGTVFLYVSRPEEVDTHPLIDAALVMGKRVAVPVSDLVSKKLSFFEIHDRKKDLLPGIYEIREPDPSRTRKMLPEEADCVIVPGVAFDRQNNRIGHGAGFYDRFLKLLKSGTPKLALAFSFQVVEELPVEAHDVPVDQIITD